MGLDLYARIEPYLEFEEQVRELHKKFLELVFNRNLNNIIDIGCGQGAFLNHLSANSINCYGIDLSVEQIKVCQAYNLNADAKPLGSVEEKFDCATAIFDVINYIPNNELQQFFNDACNVLNTKGYFIFDVNSYFGFDEVAQGCINIDLKDKFIAIDANFEEEVLTTDITLFSKQKAEIYQKEQDSIVQYYHETKLLKKLLINSGFEIEDILNFNLHAEEEADKLIFICKKG